MKVVATIVLAIASGMAPALMVVWKGEMGGITGMTLMVTGGAVILLWWMPRRQYPAVSGVILVSFLYFVGLPTLILLNQ